jgi:hypothetical protein
MIGTIGRGVLGLTLNCARCHNHKFDPISQMDYYKMQASLFGYVETDFPLTSKEQAEAYEKKVAEVDGKIKPLKREVKEIEEPYRLKLAAEKYKKYPANVQRAIAVPEEKRTPGETLLANQVIRTTTVSSEEIDRIMTPQDLAQKKALNQQVKSIDKQRPKPIPMAAGVTSFLHRGPGRYQVPPSYFLIRGDIESKGSLMKPGFVSVVTYGNPPVEDPPPNGHTSGRRRALGEWLGSPDNPLAARVIVNRIWSHHFGRSIVSTLDNFGKMGDKPTYPELLDWLAVELMNPRLEHQADASSADDFGSISDVVQIQRRCRHREGSGK